MKGCILEVNLEGKGLYITLFTIFLVLRYFWKRGNIKIRMCWNREMRHLCILGVSRKFYRKPVWFFIVFWQKKIILKALFSFIPWLFNSSDLLSYGSNSRKRCTLRILSICLGRSSLHIGRKASPLIPFSIPLDGLLI